MMLPDIGHGQCDVFSERARTIDADTGGVCAQMATAGQTVSAPTAHDMTFATDDIAGMKIAYVASDFYNSANKLMAHNHGNWNSLSGPVIPIVDMDIRSADACSINANENIVDTDFGFGHIFKPKTGFRMSLYKCFQVGLPGQWPTAC
jgi:hypothetical protein